MRELFSSFLDLALGWTCKFLGLRMEEGEIFAIVWIALDDVDATVLYYLC